MSYWPLACGTVQLGARLSCAIVRIDGMNVERWSNDCSWSCRSGAGSVYNFDGFGERMAQTRETVQTDILNIGFNARSCARPWSATRYGGLVAGKSLSLLTAAKTPLYDAGQYNTLFLLHNFIIKPQVVSTTLSKIAAQPAKRWCKLLAACRIPL